MAHCPPDLLDDLADLLAEVRTSARVIEKSPVVFYVRHQPFFHFHLVEATSATWLFPGERVRIDVACLDCGEPLTVEMLDGRLTWVDPPTVIGHLNYGFGPSRGRTPYL